MKTTMTYPTITSKPREYFISTNATKVTAASRSKESERASLRAARGPGGDLLRKDRAEGRKGEREGGCLAGQWPTHVRYEEDEGKEREKKGKKWGKGEGEEREKEEERGKNQEKGEEEELEKDEEDKREKDKGEEREKDEGEEREKDEGKKRGKGRREGMTRESKK